MQLFSKLQQLKLFQFKSTIKLLFCQLPFSKNVRFIKYSPEVLKFISLQMEPLYVNIQMEAITSVVFL